MTDSRDFKKYLFLKDLYNLSLIYFDRFNLPIVFRDHLHFKRDSFVAIISNSYTHHCVQ